MWVSITSIMDYGSVFSSCIFIWLLSIIVLCSTHFSNVIESDIDCLRSIKDSLEDTLGNLASPWDFNNSTEGFICRFIGVDCWHPDENKVLNIRLSDMGLKGSFPRGIKSCTSLTGLDLSNNRLSGPIPPDISKLLPHVTSLDLSSNDFSGEIPVNIANCSYLNFLRLDNNQLTGQIPPELGLLGRIKSFSVAYNLLSGPVPLFSNPSVPAESYANNRGLCGAPMIACKAPNKMDPFRSGFVVGYAIFTILVMLLVFFCLPSLSIRKEMIYLLNRKKKEMKQRQMIQLSRHIPGVNEINQDRKISALEKLVTRMSLAELRKATDNFNEGKVIGLGRMGVMYEAVLPNGWSLAIKRLHDWHNSDQFVSELLASGRIRHNNLVPLLGFCLEPTETILVYKYMSNGNLHDWLHTRPKHEPETIIDWPMRHKIAVGIARGLAWLHHNSIFQVAHHNISSKCILLDQNFEPKISNFGHAKFLNPNGTTSSSCRFLVNGKIADSDSYKKDVYSFGILLLELVTGKEPCKITNSQTGLDDNLVEWITHLLSGGSSCQYDGFGENLIRQGFDEEMFQVLRIARNCIQSSTDQRPTMLKVYKAILTIGDLVDELGILKTEISAANDTDPCIDMETMEGIRYYK